MKKRRLRMWYVVIVGCLLPLFVYPKDVPGDWRVIPLPQQITSFESMPGFSLEGKITVVYPAGNENLRQVASLLASYIEKLTGAKMRVANRVSGKKNIILSLDSSISEKEGYELLASANKIEVKGGTEAGVFYGAQAIHKAIPLAVGNDETPVLPAVKIKDFPRFPYRGFMIDVGRHYFPVSYLKEMIDVMAMHNINYFHWHLTEDQGWRIEIKKYPRLTEIGSKRKETIRCWDTREFDGTPYEGFYTQEEACEIVRYAAQRFITVIPEVDLPGHMMAALASYPEMGCTGGPYEVPTSWGVFPDVLCGGNEKNIEFVKDVLTELMDIFPSEYIHIGGDECPKVRWKACPRCQAKIQELGLKDTEKHTKENQLQTYFMGQVEQFINEHGRKMLGWDEIVDGGLTPNSTIVSWRSIRGGIEAARQHHNVVMAPISHLYFSNPGYNKIRGVNSVKRVYEFEPVPRELSPEQGKYVIGAQGCIWTEWTRDSLKMEWQMLPRLAALSEIQWTLPEKKNTAGFIQRLPHQLELYSVYGLHYKEDIRQVDIDIRPLEEKDRILVTMSTFDNAPIYYTNDGMDPTTSSLLYKQPLKAHKGMSIRAAAFRNGKMDRVTVKE